MRCGKHRVSTVRSTCLYSALSASGANFRLGSSLTFMTMPASIPMHIPATHTPIRPKIGKRTEGQEAETEEVVAQSVE